MFFQRIKTPGIAHVAYILAEDGKAVIVDPRRDVEEYLDILRDNGLTLRYVLETHRQEDFEMGGAQLRALTGADIVAGAHEITRHADRRMADGEVLDLAGGLRLRALHVPGHTPESTCFAVLIDREDAPPWGVFTGDCLFIGDTGRTDLADAERTGDNAGLLYDGLHAKVFPLGPQALVLPAHGAGSACGGNVANRDHSTLGIERATNKAAVLSRDAFVGHKLHERMARPPYFRLMEEVNLQAGRPFDERPVPWLDPAAFARQAENGIVIDTRAPEAFAGGHLPGAYSVWQDGLARYGGWIADADTAILLVVDGAQALRQTRLSLGRIGRDNIAGALAGGFDAWRDAGRPIAMSGTITPRQVHEAGDDFTVLDVREISEFEDEGHIPGARHIHVGHLEEALDGLGLDKDRGVVVTCSVGHRGSLGASILKRHGYRRVHNLLGGMTAWKTLDLPMWTGEQEQQAAE